MFFSRYAMPIARLKPVFYSGSANSAHLLIAGQGHERKSQLENFVYNTFFSYYNARVNHFMPLMLAFEQDDHLLAVAGVRSAAMNNLFLEQYLDESIEKLLGRFYQQEVFRRDVVEIGNLASVCLGSARFLFVSLAALLNQAESQWVVCVANPVVRAIFKKMKLPFFAVQTVDKARLGQESELWGSYYDAGCCLMVASIKDCIAVLADNPAIHREWQSSLAQTSACSCISNQPWQVLMSDKVM